MFLTKRESAAVLVLRRLGGTRPQKKRQKHDSYETKSPWHKLRALIPHKWNERKYAPRALFS